MGTHLRVLRESYPMNTNMTLGLNGFQKLLGPCALDKSSFSIGRVKNFFRIVVWIYNIFVKNYGIKNDFSKYLEECCW